MELDPRDGKCASFFLDCLPFLDNVCAVVVECPDNPLIETVAHFLMGQLDKAIPLFKRAIKRDGDFGSGGHGVRVAVVKVDGVSRLRRPANPATDGLETPLSLERRILHGGRIRHGRLRTLNECLACWRLLSPCLAVDDRCRCRAGRYLPDH